MEKRNGKTTQNFTDNIKIPVSYKLSYNFDFFFRMINSPFALQSWHTSIPSLKPLRTMGSV